MLKMKWFLLVLMFFAQAVLAQTFSQSHHKKVDKLFEVVQFDKSVEQQIDVITSSLANDPKLAVHRNRFKALLMEIIGQGTLTKNVKNIYLNNFSEKEIDELIKFYQSSSGKKLLHKMPEITKNLTEMIQSTMVENSAKINNFLLAVALDEQQIKH